MSHLTHRDIHIIQDSIREIYSDLDPDAWHYRLLSVISNIIPSNVITYNKINPTEQKVVYYQIPLGYVSPKDIPIYEKYMHEHPLIIIFFPDLIKGHQFRKSLDAGIRRLPPDFITHPEGRTMKISDFLTNNQFRRLGLYNEFYRKYDIEYQISMTLSYQPDGGEAIAVGRNGKDFSERDRLMLNLLGPHIIQAYRNAEEHAKPRQPYAALESSNQSIKSYGLTNREEDVLYWVAQGKSNAETAMILCIAPGTVKIHLERSYRKLGVENRTAASRLAMANIIKKDRTTP